MGNPPARLIAFYLPQFHPIPENDEWWGKGFTEWTNVKKARSLFPGHDQPRYPADLGYYDLRDPEVRVKQAEMASKNGIEGFCYWHYWFSGRRILERPFNEVLTSGEPNFPFCLAWANMSWTGTWHGSPDKLLLKQTYPGERDDTTHFHALLDAFRDPRYIQVQGKPLFFITKPSLLPEPKRFTSLWRELAHRAGLKGIYFVGFSPKDISHSCPDDPAYYGFDAFVPNAISIASDMARADPKHSFEGQNPPRTCSYKEFIENMKDVPINNTQHPCVVPNWDNTPRTAERGFVLVNSTPKLFGQHLNHAISCVKHRDYDKRIVFIRSWNEWAESNYLEPDTVFGSEYLESIVGLCEEDLNQREQANPTQSKMNRFLLSLWRKELGNDCLNGKHHFFDCGGNHRKAKRTANKIGEKLHTFIHSAAIYDAPTVEQFETYLARHYPFETGRFYDSKSNKYAAEPKLGPRDVVRFKNLIMPVSFSHGSSQPRNREMVFILSPPRSGSTLFRSMLAGHPNLFSPPEMNLMAFETLLERKKACSGRYQFMLEGLVRAVMQIKGCNAEESKQILTELDETGMTVKQFYSLLQEWLPDKLLVERSTSYALNRETLDLMERNFKNPKYIHLSRHPSGMIHSFEDTRFDRIFFRGEHSFKPKQLGELIWEHYHQNISGFLQSVPEERHSHIKFEDLVRQPSYEMMRICSFLDIPYTEELCQPYRQKKARMADNFAQEDPKFFGYREIKPEVANSWRQEPRHPLSESTQYQARLLGYQLDGSPIAKHVTVLDKNSNRTIENGLVYACIHTLFEEQVKKNPELVAVVFEDRHMTYGELNEAANKLAHYLMKKPLERETLIGICVRPSPEMIVGILGILKAGYAYVPLDPEYPNDRLQYMILDSKISKLLTMKELLDELPKTVVDIVCMDEEDVFNSLPESNPENRTEPKHLAYVIYTSGSTGKPKGVMIEHQSVSNLVLAQNHVFHINSQSRVLQFASLSFDASVSEIFTTLSAGARLYLKRQDTLLRGAEFAQFIKDNAISVLTLPPSFLSILPEEEFPALETLIVAGETCPPRLAQKWGLGRHFINAYGPTEATVCATVATDNQHHSIGYAIDHVQVYILNEDQKNVPFGSPGELCIGGAGVSRGYLNKPKLTAEKFIANPFGKGCLYRTGDLGRYLTDGSIEFKGRFDHQVKIRGVRIELGEIENTLSRHPLVRQAAAVVHEDEQCGKRLIAFIVSETEVSDEELLKFLINKLPRHMIPASIEVLKKLPLTLNGKIDRNALPISTATLSQGEPNHLETHDLLELQLIKLWGNVLNVQNISVQDSFFKLGGHSLSAVELFSQIKQVTGVELPLPTLFHSPTIRQIAEILRKKGWEKDWSFVVPIRVGGSKPPFFCIHGWGGHILNYKDLVNCLDDDIPFYGIQSIGLDGDMKPLHTIEEMASHYIQEICTIYPHGPYLIGGSSFGGVVAYEMARQLKAQGKEIALVALFDSKSHHLKHLKKRERIWIYHRNLIQRLFHHLGRLIFLPIPGKIKYIKTKTKTLNRRFRSQIWQSTYKRHLKSDHSLPPELQNVREINYLARKRHTPKPYSGNITLFRALQQGVGQSDSIFHGWDRVAGGVELIMSPGDHVSMLQPPHVESLARDLEKSIKKVLIERKVSS